MADTTISGIATAAGALAGADLFEIEQGGVTKKATLTQLDTFVNDAPILAAGSATAGTKPKLTAGTVLTVPEAGAFEFDGESHYRTNDTTSGRGALDLQHIWRLTANLSTRGGTIADYFDASSAFPTVANAEYELIWDLYFLKSTAGTLVWTITNTQTYANLVASYRQCVLGGLGAVGNVGEAGIVTTTTAAAALPITGLCTTATNHHVVIRALAECGTAGNIRLRVLCSAGTITPLRGSMFTARRLPPGNVGIFAA